MTPSEAPPLLSCAGAADLEKRLFDGNEAAEWEAMRRAGTAVGAAILRDFEEIGGWPEAGRLLVLVGKGHNGGDALIAAGEILRRHPRARATVAFVFGERTLRPLAWRAWRELAETRGGRVEQVAVDRLGAGGESWDLAIDGVFGFQLRPPLPEAAAAALRRVNGLDVRLRAAVDLPSGPGEPDGFWADFTYATGAVKTPAIEAVNAGRVRYLDLGFFATEREVGSADRILTSNVLAPLAALRRSHSDKRTYGHVFILGGSRSYPGAVMMNVLAALRSGVGLVTAFVPESLAPAFAARAPEAMWVGWPETSAGGLAMGGRHLLEERLDRADALLAGSGMAREPETHALLKAVAVSASIPTLLDGDALQPEIIRVANGRLLLTPHQGEFERIAGGKDLRRFCTASGATVVLKGPITRICGPDGRQVYHSLPGGPVLARGGSGDILAGLAAGQMAMLVASAGESDLALESTRLLAAARAVTWHGLAAEALARAEGQTATSVTRMLDHLSEVLREAHSG